MKVILDVTHHPHNQMNTVAWIVVLIAVLLVVKARPTWVRLTASL